MFALYLTSRTHCIHWVLGMDILGSREVDDISDIKQDMIRACLNGDGRSDVERGHQSKPSQKIFSKSASFPSAVSPSEDDEIGTALRRIFCEDSMQSSYSRSISLPVSIVTLNLVYLDSLLTTSVG